MPTLRVSDAAVIPAPPDRVYAILADYREHHPRIVPPEYFRRIEVLQGGVGAGTRTRLEVRALGTTTFIEHTISEPEPGRVLVEADVNGSSTTTFTVDPAPNGATHLTIATDLNVRPGIAGALERFMTSRLLKKIYREELARIAEYVRRPAGQV